MRATHGATDPPLPLLACADTGAHVEGRPRREQGLQLLFRRSVGARTGAPSNGGRRRCQCGGLAMSEADAGRVWRKGSRSCGDSRHRDSERRLLRAQRDSYGAARIPQAVAATAGDMVVGRTRVMLAVRRRLGVGGPLQHLGRCFAASRAAVEKIWRGAGGAEGQPDQQAERGTAAAKHGAQS